MIEINLLPVREAKRRADLRQQVMQLVLVLLLTCGAIGLVHSRLTDEIALGQGRVKQMENDIRQFKPQLDQVAAFRKKKKQLEKKIDVIDELDRARTGPVHVLDELSSRAPERLWLTGLDTTGRTVMMQGKSLDNELVAVFLRELGDSEFFDKVDLDSTELSDKENGLKLVKFKIRAVLVNPKKKPGDGKA